MKALGIVRNVDQLGRIVIPKEVRRVKGWKEGQPMEMFMSDEGLVIRPYQLDGHHKLIEQLEGLMSYTDNLEAKSIYSNAIELLKKGDA